MAVRLLLLLAVIVGAAVAAYGLFLDDSGQAIAFATAGLFLLGVALAALGVLLGTGAVGRGREGRTGRAVGGAFLGGLFMLLAAASLAGAATFAIIVLL